MPRLVDANDPRRRRRRDPQRLGQRWPPARRHHPREAPRAIAGLRRGTDGRREVVVADGGRVAGAQDASPSPARKGGGAGALPRGADRGRDPVGPRVTAPPPRRAQPDAPPSPPPSSGPLEVGVRGPGRDPNLLEAQREREGPRRFGPFIGEVDLREDGPPEPAETRNTDGDGVFGGAAGRESGPGR